MAKIVGSVPPFVGTRDNVTIYLMNGEYIARAKSSLTGERVKKDPAFARTMEWAGCLKQGARIASFIYKQMPVDERVYKQYRELTGKAMSLLKEGFRVEDVITMLEAVYLPQRVETAEGIVAGINPGVEPGQRVIRKKCVQLPRQGYGICYGRLTIIWAPYTASGQVGIAGLSCLKYADTPRQGFYRITKANPYPKAS